MKDKEKQGKKTREQELSEELEKAKADSDHWKNEYYRAFADTQNLRKSLEEDARNERRYRAEGFLAGLLPSLDAFHIALQNEPPSEETRNYLVGFRYIYNQIVKSLTDEGVTEIAPNKGDPFDPDKMHAVEAKEDDTLPPNSVLEVLAKGYKLHDRLIRPAMVSVSKAKEEAKPESEDADKKEEETKQAAKA